MATADEGPGGSARRRATGRRPPRRPRRTSTSTEDLVKRMANRRICTANGHVYNLVSNPPHDAVCDIDGSDRVASGRPRTRSVPDGAAGPPLLEVVEHYGDKVLPRSMAVWDRRGHRGPDGTSTRTRSDDGHPKVACRDRSERAPAASSANPGHPEEADPARRVDRAPRCPRRGPSADPGRPRRSRATRGSTRRPFPASVHLDRRRDRPRHLWRADDPCRPDRVGRRRRDRRRLAWRCPDLLRR